jgi:nitroreductase
MNGMKIPKVKLDIILDAISLAPSSFGLQPYSVLVIENKEMLEKIKPLAMNQPQITEASSLLVFATWDKLTSEKINIYIEDIAKQRNVSVDSLKEVKQIIEAQLNKNDADNVPEDYDLLFDARPKDDDSLKAGQAVREKKFSLLKSLRR